VYLSSPTPPRTRESGASDGSSSVWRWRHEVLESLIWPSAESKWPSTASFQYSVPHPALELRSGHDILAGAHWTDSPGISGSAIVICLCRLVRYRHRTLNSNSARRKWTRLQSPGCLEQVFRRGLDSPPSWIRSTASSPEDADDDHGSRSPDEPRGFVRGLTTAALERMKHGPQLSASHGEGRIGPEPQAAQSGCEFAAGTTAARCNGIPSG